ncbi:MAG: imidazole glycerol phosphate synthase subunit HisH [Pseudorhodoplanes sp.]|nr:imidazole glycerol phosphate synthase subunit HisH [Pseudorhodoplanes sp.]GIK79314.1 MAG: imidazole glycerol phosphate synthase subunit HisH [Alphaproteobacteria bacterium]
MLAVVDYGIGNLRSVVNALRSLGRDPQVVSRGEDFSSAAAIVLPGVGAYGDSMHNLQERGLAEGLQRQVIEGGKPFLGICIGMQVMFSRSFEHGERAGLGWIGGDVVRFEATENEPNLRIPHVGWNAVRFTREDTLLAGLGEEQDFYFVHSYHCAPADRSVALGRCDYGVDFTAIVARDNLYGVQFHPEKSHRAGLALLKNWLDRIARC